MNTAVLALAAGLLFQQQPQMYTIAGTIVDATTRAPLARARVVVIPVESRRGPQSRSAITGADGTFGFLNVPDGKYQLRAELPGRPTQLYLSDGQYSTAIVPGQGYDTEHLVFPYHAGGTIAGTVTDESGEPVRPQVHLFRKYIIEGRERIVQAVGGLSVSQGSFRFAHLEAGEYYVAVIAQPWYAAHPFVSPHPSNVSPPQPSPELDVAYALTYYPGTSDFASATPIAITDGAMANIQLSLRAVQALHIRSAQSPVREDNGRTVRSSSAMVVGPDGVLLPMMNTMAYDGVISGLAPGTYSVSTGSSGPGPQARQIVRLTGDTAIDPATSISPTVSGKVTVEGPVQPTNRIIVALNGHGQNASASAKEDGTFEFKGQNLAAVRYGLAFPANPVFFIKDVTATGGTVADGELELRDNSNVQLHIVLAQAAQSKLEGVVVQNGKPLPGAMVLLLPVKSTGADLVRRDQSDLDGSFTLPGVPSGEYYLLAIDHGRDLAYRDKSVIRPYLAKASRIDVSALKSDLKVEAQTRVAK